MLLEVVFTAHPLYHMLTTEGTHQCPARSQTTCVPRAADGAFLSACLAVKDEHLNIREVSNKGGNTAVDLVVYMCFRGVTLLGLSAVLCSQKCAGAPLWITI